LAVALLKDRNGVIDINLPIGGSLEDPQFSVGGVIVKVNREPGHQGGPLRRSRCWKAVRRGRGALIHRFDPGRTEIAAAGERA